MRTMTAPMIEKTIKIAIAIRSQKYQARIPEDAESPHTGQGF